MNIRTMTIMQLNTSIYIFNILLKIFYMPGTILVVIAMATIADKKVLLSCGWRYNTAGKAFVFPCPTWVQSLSYHMTPRALPS